MSASTTYAPAPDIINRLGVERNIPKPFRVTASRAVKERQRLRETLQSVMG